MYKRQTYNDPSVRTRVGIDVSQYQGDVDWNAVARTDVDFVIARVGGRGYTCLLYTSVFSMRKTAISGASFLCF